MAGKGGGGAWKVAYADFVTAMMAFFLVMWICGQDQKVKTAVSYYFNDPLGNSKESNSQKSRKSGSMTEGATTGSVPQSESVDLGRGRDTYSVQDEVSLATKLVSDWLRRAQEANQYWREQALTQRELALASKHVRNKVGADELAALQLSKQLKYEISREVTSQGNGLCKDLLTEVISKVNWLQIAEDFLDD